MDWDPSAPAVPGRPAALAEPSRQESPPAPAGKRAPRTVQRAAPASGSRGAAAVAPSQTDQAPDPWARAVEQAPGIWVIGSETNVGKGIEASVTTEELTAAPAPSYEPATAQVPQAPQVNGLSDADASWGLLPSDAGQAGEPARQVQEAPGPQPTAPQAGEPADPQAPASQAAAPEPAAVPEYAMASAVAPAAHLQPAPAASASAAAARQSLYQRLSNSPEAEAGRAKAPARAVATLVQDIPSADDETIEESGVFGRAAVERILGGKLIEERSSDGSPIVPRF